MSEVTVQTETSDAPSTMRGLKDFWFYFSVNRGAVIGLFVFTAIILVAIFAPLVAPHNPTEQYREFMLRPPFGRMVAHGVFRSALMRWGVIFFRA